MRRALILRPSIDRVKWQPTLGCHFLWVSTRHWAQALVFSQLNSRIVRQRGSSVLSMITTLAINPQVSG
jgi:hypothetical protein